jgi:hypothetical protein
LDKLRHVLSKHWCQLLCSELGWAFTHRTTPVLKVLADVALDAPSKSCVKHPFAALQLVSRAGSAGNTIAR